MFENEPVQSGLKQKKTVQTNPIQHTAFLHYYWLYPLVALLDKLIILGPRQLFCSVGQVLFETHLRHTYSIEPVFSQTIHLFGGHH